MPRTHPPPRLARSARRTIQRHPSDPPKTAKTIARLRKTDHPDCTISSKTLDFRPIQPASGKFPSAASTRGPDRRSNHTPSIRTEPNKPEHCHGPDPPRITRTHPEPHRQNLPITRQIWTNLDFSGHKTPQFPAHSTRSDRFTPNFARNATVKKFILFDNDGVLVETEHWYYLATRRALVSLGLELPRDEYLVEHGQRNLSLASGPRLRASPQAEIKRGRAQRDRYYREYLTDRETSRSRAVIETLAELSETYRMAIVTTSKRPDFNLIHEHRSILDYMEFHLTEGDYERAKPHPEPYLTRPRTLRRNPRRDGSHRRLSQRIEVGSRRRHRLHRGRKRVHRRPRSLPGNRAGSRSSASLPRCDCRSLANGDLSRR